VHISYHKKDSRNLGRPMEHKRYGHAGRPVVVFPTSGGRFFQYEDSGAVEALSESIDEGRIQLWTLDGIDRETFLDKNSDPQTRIGRHDAYFRYVREEAFPDLVREARISNGGQDLKPLVTGCSMGAFHAANFLFHFPELTAGVIALSGVYSTRDFFGSTLDGGIFYHSPLDYLAGLNDARMLSELRSRRMIFCCGQGAWEERMLIETRELEQVLRDKDIPAWVDYWGTDVNHDWPWWHRQLKYFMSRWLDGEVTDPRG
jgi:esterase/lipase superfamily enzyme